MRALHVMYGNVMSCNAGIVVCHVYGLHVMHVVHARSVCTWYVCMCVYACMHACMYACVYVRVYVFLYVCMYVCM